MSQEEFKFNNPIIDFITDAIRDIYNKLNSGQSMAAKKNLYHFVVFLDPVVKEKLKDTIKQVEELYLGRNPAYPSIIITMSKNINKDQLFRDCLKRIVDALYRAGYLSPQTFVRRG